MASAERYWAGFDLGATKMLAVVFDEKFRPVGRARKKTRGFEGKEAGLERIIDLIRQAVRESGRKNLQLAGIGIGCPGPLDLKKGIILESPNLGWKNVPVRSALEDAFACPVSVVNDVDAGVYGEYRFGAVAAHCVAGIFPGTGIGGGCVYRGQLIQGANCTAMEIGHIPILADGPLDGAGNQGTLEAVASRLAIAGAAAAAAQRGQAPHLMKMAGTDLAAIRSSTLAKAIEEGDTVIADIVRHAAGHLSQAVVTLILLLAPDVIVMGGGLVEAMPELFLKEVRKRTRERLLPAFRNVCRIVAAELGDDAAVQGAAAWAREIAE